MKISIITTTYNSSKTLLSTIESVLHQSYTDIEFIIIDGGSQDNTLEIIRTMEPYFSGRLYWISEPDKGMYDAMNKGIAIATGDVIGILNSDDFYTSPHVLKRIATELKSPSIDAVYGDIHFVNDSDLDNCVRYYSSQRFRRWQMRLGFMPAHPSFYCRQEVYNKLGDFNCSYKVAADFEHLLRLIFVHRIRTKYIPLDCVTMRTGGASTSGTTSHIQILKDHLRAYKENGVFSNILFESLRYIYKLTEVIYQKVYRQINSL
ncbi:glycosyltransferase family 2 protein [Bacteroides sp. 519]|uniref:glycosyltransferase family 2 protein n=1 Tax=Bacteroides sp. 519 TaxID=2302937 RepID=UPI0013D1B649|nr:glycosyltransferase family 2 protein [Bacteroides sp. 519]NDV57793.1 glycosyltransferase [Bacteroides sp. 519]